MRLAFFVAVILGLAVATGVAAWVGFDAVAKAVGHIGWRGLAVLAAYSLLPFTLLGSSWWVLAYDQPVARAPVFIWARMVRDAAAELLPFSQLGGFVIGARAAMERGVAAEMATATTVVDLTAEFLAQLGFTALGLILLGARLGGGGHGDLVGPAMGGLGLSALGAAGFILLQRRGGGFLERLVARAVPAAAEGAGRVVDSIGAIYGHPLRLAAAVLAHFAAWIASALGVWLALVTAGVSITPGSMIAIEALVCAIRSAAFVAPMAIGVQEASYAFLGPLFGLGPELALAVSLLKRANSLVVGAPALLVWQGLEGARLARRPTA